MTKSPDSYLKDITRQYVLYSSKENRYFPITKCLSKAGEVNPPKGICVVLEISALEKLLGNKE